MLSATLVSSDSLIVTSDDIALLSRQPPQFLGNHGVMYFAGQPRGRRADDRRRGPARVAKANGSPDAGHVRAAGAR